MRTGIDARPPAAGGAGTGAGDVFGVLDRGLSHRATVVAVTGDAAAGTLAEVDDTAGRSPRIPTPPSSRAVIRPTYSPHRGLVDAQALHHHPAVVEGPDLGAAEPAG